MTSIRIDVFAFVVIVFVFLFLQFASDNPQLRFLLTEIGCGLAGYTPKEIAPLFANHTENVILPGSFLSALNS